MCFGCSKEPFEYPQHMKNTYQLRTLMWGPGHTYAYSLHGSHNTLIVCEFYPLYNHMHMRLLKPLGEYPSIKDSILEINLTKPKKDVSTVFIMFN